MAGYVIHLAIAETYKNNYPEDIENYEEFIKGVISPDSVKDKAITHYGIKSSKVNLKSYLEQNEIDSSYNKGYFLHLVTDYLFYNKFLDYFSKDIYNDYDILNKDLIEIFDVKIPEGIQDSVFYKDGKTKILNLDSTIDFINEVAKYRLQDIKEKVQNNDSYWLEFKNIETPKV